MTINTSRVDLKALAAGAAVVGALACAPAVYAQQTGTGQPGGVGQQEGLGQPSQMGQPGMDQPGGTGQPGGMGQQDRHGQPSQMGQPSGTAQPGGLGEQDRFRQPSQMGQPSQPGHPTGLGQQREPYGQPSQPGGMGHYDQPSEMTQPGASTGTELGGKSPENIRRVQEALKAQGQDLEVDGAWGPRTSSAVQKFQQEQGLEATGQLDPSTLQALRVGE